MSWPSRPPLPNRAYKTRASKSVRYRCVRTLVVSVEASARGALASAGCGPLSRCTYLFAPARRIRPFVLLSPHTGTCTCRPVLEKEGSLPSGRGAVSRTRGCNERHNVRFVRIQSTARPLAPTQSPRVTINRSTRAGECRGTYRTAFPYAGIPVAADCPVSQQRLLRRHPAPPTRGTPLKAGRRPFPV